MRRRRSVIDRFYQYVRCDEGCWEWIGARTAAGYGEFALNAPNDPFPRMVLAHRLSFELHHAEPIPKGLVLDHLCRNRGCVNPSHLEPVEGAENVRRGEPARRTHCPQGHEYTPENTSFLGASRGWHTRRCNTCHREQERRRRWDRCEEDGE